MMLNTIQKLIVKIGHMFSVGSLSLDAETTPSSEEHKFKIGDKIIAVSNEDEPYNIGHVIDYYTNEKLKHETPIVKFVDDDREYICFSHLEHYSQALENKLKNLKPIEQWNFCVCRHVQIKEKYNVTYRTFKCMCENCIKRAKEMKKI